MTDISPADPAARVAALEQELATVRAQADSRLVQAELKAQALRLGIVDLRCLDFIDRSALKLNEDGTVPEAATVLARFKRETPWAFAQTSSSHAAAAPAPEPPQQKTAMEMTHQEWRQARALLLKHS